MTSIPEKRILVGITGASGVLYAKLLLQELARLDLEIHLIVSAASLLVMREELGMKFRSGRFDMEAFLGVPGLAPKVVEYGEGDLAAAPASGTFRSLGMIVCPCSMKTLGQIAHGTGGSLITRAADSCLKERRPLVLIPRETPLSLVQLRNMVSVTEAGAIVLPAMPGFYHRPETIEELARHVILKSLDAVGIESHMKYRWKDPEE